MDLKNQKDMKKEKVLDILYQLGFQPEQLDDDFGYQFEYEGLTLLYSPEEDSQTLNLMVPAIFRVTEENKEAVLAAMVGLCGKMKFVQPALYGNSVWLNYQHYLGEQEPTEDLLEHMIKLLGVSTYQFNKILNSDGDDE